MRVMKTRGKKSKKGVQKKELEITTSSTKNIKKLKVCMKKINRVDPKPTSLIAETAVLLQIIKVCLFFLQKTKT